jgi:hypothetical protein
MRTAPPQALRGARSVVLARPRPRPAAPPVTTLKILFAGIDKDARGPVEERVRRVLGPRTAVDAWTVSLVRHGQSWSVTLYGPRDPFRSVSLTSDDAGLERAIREALGDSLPGPATAGPRPPAPAAEPALVRVEERHACTHCRGVLLVVYESKDGESRESAPVACPHCWRVSQVPVGSWAAAGGDYRCEKATTQVPPA